MAASRLASLPAAGGLILCLVAAPGAWAGPDRPDAPIVVTPRNPTGTLGPPAVDVRVLDSGSESGRPDLGAAGRPGGGRACRWRPAPDLEAWIRRFPAAAGVRPGQVGPLWRLHVRDCGGVAAGYRWFRPGLGGLAGARVERITAAGLAREAYARLRLPVPTPEHSPDLRLADGRSAVLVGEHTWVWTDRSRFRRQSRRLQVGPVWAQVTATPTGLTFDPGNGDPAVSCLGPGTEFVPGRYPLHAPSATCGYQYSRSSAEQPGGVVTAEYGISWRVRWSGWTGTAPAGGQLPDMTSRSTTRFAVAEAQALGTTGVQR